MTKSN